MDTDIYRFLESMKFRPETYRTILGLEYDNKSTVTNLIRKKLAKFVNNGLVMSGLLDGRIGDKIFFSPEKNYYVVIVRNENPVHKFDYYYCSSIDYGKTKNKAMLFNAFILGEFDWINLGNIELDVDKVRRWF